MEAEMFFLIFSLTFLFFAGLAFLFGALKGRKYVWQFSVSRIILNVLSAIVAAVLSGVVARVLSDLLLDPFRNMAALDAIREIGLNIAIENVIVVIIASVAAGIAFLPIFAIVRCLAKLALKALAKLFVKITGSKTLEQGEAQEGKKRKKYDQFKTPKSNMLGAVCGGVCGLITLIVLSIPAVGALNTVNDIAYKPLAATDSTVLNTVAEVTDASANNVGATVVKYTGGQLLFDAMTYAEAEDVTSVTVKEDLVTVSDIATVAIEYDLLSQVMDSPQQALTNEDCMSEIFFLLLENPRLSPVIDTVSDFAIRIMLDTVQLPEDVAPLYDSFLEDIDAVELPPIQPRTVDYSPTEELEKKFSDIFDDYGLRVDADTLQSAVQAKLSGADMRSWARKNIASNAQDFVLKSELVSIHDVIDGRAEVTDAQKESKSLARAFAVLVTMADDMESSNMQSILKKLGPALDAFNQTETVGAKKTESLLKGLLQSKMVHDEIGLSVLDATDTAVSICENSQEKGFEPMLNSLSKAIEVVSAASDSSKDTKEAVKEMMDDLTPESSKVLQTMTTPSVVQSYNVPEKSAEPVSNMLSDTFGNLADAKDQGMSDEEYEKETAAVSNMMDILMTIDQTNSSVFGEDSVTGITAEEYVNNIMDSKVMSQTVMDNVYTDGVNATTDPLNSERALADSEKETLLAALSSNWEGSDKSEETQKKLIATAAVLNFQIQIVDGVVSEVVPPVVPQQ